MQAPIGARLTPTCGDHASETRQRHSLDHPHYVFGLRHRRSPAWRRIWRRPPIETHRVEAFKIGNDPAFADWKTFVGGYLNPPEHALVLCADEKNQSVWHSPSVSSLLLSGRIGLQRFNGTRPYSPKSNSGPRDRAAGKLRSPIGRKKEPVTVHPCFVIAFPRLHPFGTELILPRDLGQTLSRIQLAHRRQSSNSR